MAGRTAADGAATREALLQAALRTVTQVGIAKASARTIAAEAGVNQALVFHHFGSVDGLLGAACVHGATTRVELHRPALAAVTSLGDLVALARTIHETEVAEGNVNLLGQLLAGALSHPALAGPVSEGLGLWVREVEAVLDRLLSPTVLRDVVDVPGLARAVSASFVGLELYEAVDPDGAGRALGSLQQLAVLLAAFEDLGPVAERAVRRQLRRRKA